MSSHQKYQLLELGEENEIKKRETELFLAHLAPWMPNQKAFCRRELQGGMVLEKHFPSRRGVAALNFWDQDVANVNGWDNKRIKTWSSWSLELTPVFLQQPQRMTQGMTCFQSDTPSLCMRRQWIYIAKKNHLSIWMHLSFHLPSNSPALGKW